MPLILIVGLPSSGKTTRAREIQKYFTEHQHKEVILISDNEIISQMNIDKNVLFLGKSVLNYSNLILWITSTSILHELNLSYIFYLIKIN